MIFLDPKTDIAFKKLFANKKKKSILISFLNSVLERKRGNLITSVTILDPFNYPVTLGHKLSIVDLRCEDEQGKIYVVEMQLNEQKDYGDRSVYYAAMALSQQLKAKERYHNLTPVIFIGVLDFSLFKSKEYLSHHLILNSKTHEHALQLIEFHFIELPKFKKTIDNLDGIVDKWIYLLQNAEKLKNIPKQLTIPGVLEEALETLEQGHWSTEELAAYEAMLDQNRVAASVLMTAEEKGEKKALIKVAKTLLMTHSTKEIARITELTAEEIEELKK
jgi:predicted transposase/invertase (TIGR01784 family)